MRLHPLSVLRLSLLSAALLIQPASVSVSVADMPLAPLPSPGLGDEAKPSEYLRAAAGALATGHLGQAESALEMAQTRLLDRSVPLGRTHEPSVNPTVAKIAQARQALAAHDRATCMQLIQTALISVTAQGL